MTKSSEPPSDVEVLMQASKLFTAVVARSMSRAESAITTPQLRLLVVLDARGRTNLSALAAELQVDPSTASRTCDQLVRSGLVSRAEDPEDRRRVTLSLSRRGEASVERLMSRRREVLTQVVDKMPRADRRHLTSSLAAFLRAADDIVDPVEDRCFDSQPPSPTPPQG